MEEPEDIKLKRKAKVMSWSRFIWGISSLAVLLTVAFFIINQMPAMNKAIRSYELEQSHRNNIQLAVQRKTNLVGMTKEKIQEIYGQPDGSSSAGEEGQWENWTYAVNQNKMRLQFDGDFVKGGDYDRRYFGKMDYHKMDSRLVESKRILNDVKTLLDKINQRSLAQIKSHPEGAKWTLEEVARRNELFGIIKKHPYWTQEMAENVLMSNVVIGMNKEQVSAILGDPDDINTTVGSWGTNEQWVYAYEEIDEADYYYFENGILTSYQESK